jgi:hypothetical protein
MPTTDSAIDLFGRFDRIETADVAVDAQRAALFGVAQDLGCGCRISARAEDRRRSLGHE